MDPTKDHALQAHDIRLHTISDTVKDFHTRQIPFRIYHGSTNSTRPLSFQRNAIVDTSPLSHILSISAGTLTALVEPNVRMDALVDAALAVSCIPPVVPEFPAITVGGAFAGTAGESSSFREGLFDSVVNWCEVVLGNGEVLRASKTEKADLFEGSKGAMGTLGVCTLFEIRLERTDGWVRLEYVPVRSAEEMMVRTKEVALTKGDGRADYLDGIMFARNRGVVMVGKTQRTSDEDLAKRKPKARFTRAHDPWLYLHADKVLRKIMDRSSAGKTYREYVPMRDYIFRYDRGGFWTAPYAFQIFHTPFNRVTRFVLNPLMHTERMYKALHLSGLAQRCIVQDVAVPVEALPTFLEWITDKFSIFPLWICPIKPDTKALLQHCKAETDLVYNVGVWGAHQRYMKCDDWYTRFVNENRMLEEKVTSLGGIKCLYAQTFYTEDEFWSIFDKVEYDKLRTKWHAEGLPDVYQKVKPRQKPGPVQPYRGVIKLLLGRNHILTSSRSERGKDQQSQATVSRKEPADDDS